MFLKHAIDTINAFRAFSERLSKATRSPIGGLAVMLLAAILLAATVQKVEGQSSPAPAHVADAQSGVIASSSAQGGGSGPSSDKSAPAKQKPATDEPANSASHDSGQDGTPSTAGASTTDSSASFTTKITANGQISAGTLIANNAKHEKTYYGGDLILSAASVTISKAADPATATATINITTPDTAPATVPVVVADATSSYFQITADNGATDPQAASAAYKLQISPVGDVPVGIYQLHLSVVRAVQSNDTWVYHVFLTVNVTD